MNAQFYIYTHARPDGSIFYVGKGMARRAYDFAPRRRTNHHLNIVNKHGRKNIIISITYCDSEELAFNLEKQTIAALRADGIKLINLTDGGEGCSGRKATAKQLAAFALGRGRQRYDAMSDEAKQSILDGLARGREKNQWRKSDQGISHQKQLHLRSVAELATREFRFILCPICKHVFQTKSLKAKCCSKICNARYLRATKGKYIRKEHRNALNQSRRPVGQSIADYHNVGN